MTSRRRSPALELALLLCPRGFRDDYREQIRAHAEESQSELGAAFDVARYGIGVRLEGLARDVVFALRGLAKARMFTAVSLVTLALAISVNAAVFAVMHAVLLRPLPFTQPDRLVFLCPGQPPFCRGELDNGTIGALQAHTASLSGVGAMQSDDATMTGHGLPEALSTARVSTNIFAVLGVRPELGRTFVPGDGDERALNVVISDRLWRTVLGGDPRVIGTRLVLDGMPWRIVGVAPASAVMPWPMTDAPERLTVDAWRPLPRSSFRQFGGYRDWTFARLAPGSTSAQVARDVADAAAAVVREHPVEQSGLHVTAVPFGAWYRHDARTFLGLTLAAVGAVLLIACANVANLLLVRTVARRGELALRNALGATRGRIVRELMIEVALVALAGGALGVALAAFELHALAALAAPFFPGIEQSRIDASAVAFTFGLVLAATILAGIVPALLATRTNLAGGMRSIGRGADRGSMNALRTALAVIEIALTFGVASASGLFVRSSLALAAAPLGFDPHDTFIAGVALFGPHENDAQRAAFARDVAARLRALPGVGAASFARPALLSSAGPEAGGFQIVGRTYAPGTEPFAIYTQIGIDYFRTLHIPLVRGRAFTAADDARSARVAIVDRHFVRRYLGGQDPIGTRLSLEPTFEHPGPRTLATIVGVVADAAPYRFADDTRVYVPNAQSPTVIPTFVIRMRTPDPDLRRHVAQVVAAVDPSQSVATFASMERLSGAQTARAQSNAALLGVLALVALVLALAGIYAIVSYAVEQRRHEFGIRMAVGAQPGHIVRGVLGGALRIALLGIAAGVVIAALATRSVEHLLYAVATFDPLTLGAVALLLLLCVTLAAALPAARAMRVDPAVALRYE